MPSARGRARRPALAVAVVALLAGAAFWAWRAGSEAPVPPAIAQDAPASTPDVAGNGVQVDPSALPAASTPVDALRARLATSSLRGAAPDGGVTLDAAGRVVPDAALRRLFDWYLTLTGEFAADEIRTLLLADIAVRHGDVAAADAADLFAAYVGMRAELSRGDLSPDLAVRLAQVKAAHRRWFGEHAEAMFGDEEAALAYTVERRALLADATLSPEDRAARLRALEQTRPAHQRAAETDATSAQLADEQTRQLEEDGADAATRHAERAALWGDAAADRLAALDAQRSAWDGRVAAYAAARRHVLADPSLDATARDRRLAALLGGFDAAERRRLEALAAVGALPTGP